MLSIFASTYGHPLPRINAATLYIEIRYNEFPRNLKQIVSASRSDKKEISRCYKTLCSGLNLKPPPIDIIKMVPWLIRKLKLSDSVKQRAFQILENALHSKITSGRQPVSLVASALYIAAIEMGERRSQLEVSEAAQITDVTLRNRYKELKRELKLSFQV